MTQEVTLTVDNQFQTLSNGLLTASRKNNDGTRTDTWKQTLPAPPYLTMIAVGELSDVEGGRIDSARSWVLVLLAAECDENVGVCAKAQNLGLRSPSTFGLAQGFQVKRHEFGTEIS